MRLILPAIMILAMYLLLIRPQQQRVKAHQQVVSTLEEGDEVVTAGGLVGTVIDLDQERVTLEVAPQTKVQFLRPAISRRLVSSKQE